MSSKEHLPEGLNDTERMLLALSPRASRIDRDRLMIALGEQAATRSATPWKWATGASLLLALGLGVRPAFVSTNGAPAEFAIQSETEAPQPAHPEAVDRVEAVAPPAADLPVRDEADWLTALASGRFDSSQPLSVRPQFAPSGGVLRSAEVAVRDDTQKALPPREPMLRWGDHRLGREKVESIVLPKT